MNPKSKLVPSRHLLSRRAVAAPLSLLTACFLVSPAHAATKTWDGGGADGNWATGANWDANTAPVANDILLFDQNVRLAAINDFAAATQFNGLSFATTAGAFTLSGSSITLGGDITNSARNAQIIGNALSLGVTPTINVSSRAGSLTLSGVISGSNGITKTGSGLLTLSTATNTFTGPVTVNGGTLSIDNDARLGAAPGAATPGSIVLDGGALRVSAGITINANRGIAVGNAGGTINTFAGTTTYSGIIAGAGGLTKTGAGQLNLNGVNTYTGATTINQGTLQLDGNAGASISGSSALVMGGSNTSLGVTSSVSNALNSPTLLVQAASAPASTQTFAGLTLNQGNANIAFRSIGAVADTLALGTITHNGGGLVNFTRLKDNVASANAVLTTSSSNTNGILGGWAVTNADAAVGGVAVATATDWAANDGSGNIVAYSAYTVPTGATPVLVSNAASNVRIDGTSTGNLSLSAGTTDLNTIQMTDTLARTIAVGSGNTLRLGASGGVWKTQGNGNPLTIGSNDANRGSLTAGGATNTAGEIVFNANALNTSNSGIIVNSVIANNGTGVVGITKTGQGSLSLTGTNTYTGNTYVNQGRLVTDNTRALGGDGTTAGSGTVYVQPSGQVFFGSPTNAVYANNFVVAGSGTNENGNFGALRFGNTMTVGTSTSTITLAGDARFGRNNDTNTVTLAGRITGNHNLELTSNAGNSDANRNVFLLTNTGNDWGGNIGINAVNLGAGQTAANNGNNTAILRLGASEVISNGAGKGNVIIGGGTTAGNNNYLDLNGFNETINGLGSAGTGAQARVTNGRSGTPAAATLTLGDGDATATFAGIIENGTGTTALTKIGNGTQTLSGANTYTGTTRLSGGILELSSTGSLSATTPFVFDITNAVHGQLAVQNASFSYSGSLVFNIGAITTSGSVTLFSGSEFQGSDLTLSGITSDATAWTNAGGGIWTLSNFGDNSFNGSFDQNLGTLSFTAVPEPHQYALLIGGLLFVVIVMRRRRASI